MKLSILDQSPVISGLGARRAIEETLALARRADELGYHRYWLAEHHAIAALADPCPEILLARLGAETRRLRVGTGGVLLPYYSAFRTAETFRMLEALVSRPHRPRRRPRARRRRAHRAGGRRRALSGCRALPAAGVGAGRTAGRKAPSRCACSPKWTTVPEVWLLGSSDYSGALAAELGLASPSRTSSTRAAATPWRAPTARCSRPPRRAAEAQVIVCTFAIVGESDDDAERLAASIDLRRLHMALNIDSPVPTPEEAARHRYSDEERRYVLGQRARAVIGGPQKAKRELKDMAERYGADELMVLTITGDYDSRRRSYELLIDAF